MGKKKVLVLIGTMFFIVVSVYLVYAWYDYKHVEIINLEDLESINMNEMDLNNPQDLSSILEEVKQQEINDGRVNPRLKVFYHSVEVGYIDHLGNIGGFGNSTFTNETSGYGFFQYLGDKATHITLGWFDDVNATNLNTSRICNGGDCYTLSDLNTTTVDTDSNLSEDDVEAYIFDSDNTANLDMNTYNITGINYTHFGGGGYIYDNGTAIIIGHS